MGGGVSEYVAACRSCGIAEECLRVRLHLIRDYDSEIDCLRQSGELVEVRVESLLAFSEGFASDVFASEMRQNGVDDEEFDFLFLAELEGLIHSEDLVVAVVDACKEYSFEDLLGLKLHCLRYLVDSFS